MVSEIVPPPPALRDSGLAGQCCFNGVSAIQRETAGHTAGGTYARALRTGMKTTDTRIHPESTVRTEMGAKPVETLDTDNYEFLKTPYSGPKHPIFRAETSDIQGRNIRYSGPRHPIFRAETRPPWRICRSKAFNSRCCNVKELKNEYVVLTFPAISRQNNKQ